MLRTIAIAATLLTASVALADNDPSPTGFEIGVRTGYAWSAGDTGATPNGNNNNVGDYVTGQVPLWLDAGYRFSPMLYLGGYFQYGIGLVNSDRQDLCRNSNVDCSASDVRVGVMGRLTIPVRAPVAPWVGFGLGLEWGTFSLHQSVIGSTSTDFTWSGYEIANFQGGVDYRVSPLFAVAPFASVSFGRFQGLSTTTTNGNSTTTMDEDLDQTEWHEWILVGVRLSFSP